MMEAYEWEYGHTPKIESAVLMRRALMKLVIKGTADILCAF